jgi:hypothetical protein
MLGPPGHVGYTVVAENPQQFPRRHAAEYVVLEQLRVSERPPA